MGNTNTVKNIPGYDIFQFSKNDRVKACIIIKSGSFATLGMSEFSSPNLSIVQIITKKRKLFLASVYIEPKVDENSTLNRLELFLKAHQHAQILIGGDFNGWHTTWGSPKNNKRGNDIHNLITSQDLVVGNIGDAPTFSTITHGINRSSIIDITLCTDNLSHKLLDWKINADACPSSDHEAIDYILHQGDITLAKKKKQSTYKYRTDEDDDWLTFNNNLINSGEFAEIEQGISELHNGEQIDMYVANITKKIQDICDKTFRRKKFINTHAPWWNSELDKIKNQVIKIHHRIQDLVRSGKSIENALLERNEIKEKYAKEIRKASTEHFRLFCNRQGKENVWSLTNRLLKNIPQSKPCVTVSTGSSHHTTSTIDTAKSLLNQFYPDDDEDKTHTQKLLRAQMKETPNTQNDKLFTEEEVLGCLESMSAKKAPGTDHLTADICLAFTKEFTSSITKLMNTCLEKSYFPKDWKVAHVKILPKPNRTDYTDTSSYRPIGLINIFGKLLEKLICNRLTFYLDKNNLSNPQQYGFKQQISTVDALKNAIDIISEAKANKQLVIAISLDIRAAFDNAWWPVLFKRLRQFGCPRNLYLLILNYIKDRKVLMNYADITISKTMSRGCIQGSVCGPLFWNIILDDLFDVALPEGCHIQAFADDVLLIVKNKKSIDLQIAANTALKSICKWGNEVKLTFGPNKTQIIAFTPKAKAAQIVFNGSELQFVDEIKFLGVIIDKNLKFIKHIKYVISKSLTIYRKLSKFTRPTWGAHPDNVRIIYKQVIEPTITYAAGVWGSVVKYETAKHQLRSLQRGFATKIIRSFRTVSATAAIALARLTPLHLKIREVEAMETTKALGTTDLLPSDITLEKPARSNELLHPADRKSINFEYANTHEDINKYCSSECTLAYTDGSKLSEYKVGAAFVAHSPNGKTVTKKYKLHGSCSVFQAELHAIQNACSWAVQNNITNLAILSDSLSSLYEIKNKDSINQAVVTIHKIIQSIINNNGKVTFIWVKAHTGLAGNEEADAAAKAAADSPKAYEYTKFPISIIKHKMKAIHKVESEEIFNSGIQGQHTRDICNSLETIHNLFNIITPSFEMTQILTGHGYNLAYLHRFKIKNTDRCPCDSSTPQTIKHLLEDCPKFNITRNEHTFTCRMENINYPFNIPEIIKKERCIKSFENLAKKIIQSLKEFNKDII